MNLIVGDVAHLELSQHLVVLPLGPLIVLIIVVVIGHRVTIVIVVVAAGIIWR